MVSGREKAYAYLRDTVLTDPEMQGAFLSEQEVADRIGVSRTPVREALLLLAAEDLVELVPKRGARVAALTGREITELMELRGVVERYAAERLVTRDRVPLAELRALLDRQGGLTGPEQAREFIDVDHLFHATLVSAVGNTLLDRHYDGLRSRQVRAGVVALFHRRGRQEAVLDVKYTVRPKNWRTIVTAEFGLSWMSSQCHDLDL
ncbi:GntR family transcriptional regulator, partial [Streptomyces sp. NPDC026666]|uniref:GntR family transcriptional regulator n=1 Tax=Streptomyces sp. NPDC026666 TaxID=3154799 RepID=UPI0034546DB5